MHLLLTLTPLTLLTAFASASYSSGSPWSGPWGAPPTAPSNNGKVCTVHALGKKRDDTPQILKAFEDCNNGGTVSFPADQNYWIATKLNPVIYDVTVEWRGVWTVRTCCG